MVAKGEICELKRGSGIKITKMKSPKVLWDDCLDLEAYIRSNTALDIFELDRMNPESNILHTDYLETMYHHDISLSPPQYNCPSPQA